MKCSKCGTESNAKFCENCGSPMTEAETSSQSMPQQQMYTAPIAQKKKPFYKKWWFWVIVVVVIIGIGVGGSGENDPTTKTGGKTSETSQSSSITSNVNDKSSKPTESSKPTKNSKPATNPEPTISKYEQIYNEYAKKIRDAAPNVSITELAEISNEGVSKMAEYMYSAKGTDGQYATYEKWSQKLMDVYMKEAR